MRTVLLVVLFAFLAHGSFAAADVLDPDSAVHPVLERLAPGLGAVEVDVLYRHDSEAGRAGPSFGDPPRLAPLLGLKGWTSADLDLEQHRAWMNAFAEAARGAVAAVPSDAPRIEVDPAAFRSAWDAAEAGARVFLTFDAGDLETVRRVAHVLEAAGYVVHLAVADSAAATLDPAELGRMFAQADHVLMFDTVSARLNGIVQFEADLLAELQRQRDWVASGAEGLPPIRRGSMDVVEALGALPMQILPGGIVLGTKPHLDPALAGGTRFTEGSAYGLAVGERRFAVAQVSDETRTALEAFVRIADSHSVVDIAGGAMTLAAPLRGTRIGRRMIAADRAPFEHLSVRGAGKSLIVDDRIAFRPEGDRLAADVTLEVRFYRTDDNGHAARVATLGFTVEDATGSARLLDLRWSRPRGTRVAFDGSGCGDLTEALENCALDAALVALARWTPPTAR